MKPERWHSVEDLYHRALQLDATRRVAFLQRSCSHDETLQREVESLLAHDKTAENFMESPALEVAGKLLADDLTLAADGAAMPDSDRTIGSYRLVQQIGQGGMGEVWLADQKYPVRRRVALKLIRSGMDTREVITRFESERQALALMDHPAVAKVFDGGSTSSGLPYFVMEYVPGMPITDWCDKHKLTVPERLELFIQVCEGVKHAHQKAIIHRDLKPSNILVTEVDGRPVPKIIDFGVAKAISQKLSQDTLLTRVGVILGTPEYMSPEQANSMGEDIDTRTDVYSLGIILYQLLVGATPVELRQLTLEEMLRKLREEDPPRPSTKLRALGQISTVICLNRGSERKVLVRQLQGDLDSIVLKALEKQRARRYGSPSELVDDIRHYLRREPVVARPQSSWYRAEKFVRRHRWAMGAVASIALALTVGLSAALWEAHVARTQAQVAKSEAQTSAAVQQFITDIFLTNSRNQADPLKARQTTARQLLDIGAQKVEGSLHNALAAKVKMLGILAELDFSLGLEEQSVALHRKRVVGMKALYGANDPKVAAALCDMAASMGGNERKAVLLEAKRILDGNHDFSSATRGDLLRLLSVCYRDTDRQKALDFGSQAVVFYRALPPSHLLAEALANQGAIYGYSSDSAKAEALFAEAVSISRKVVGDHDPALPLYASYLGQSETALMHYEAAKQSFELALRSARALNGDEHVDTAETEARLGQFFSLTSQNAEALRHLKHSLDVCLKLKGVDDPSHTPHILLRYGESLVNSGQFEDGLTSISLVAEKQRKNRPGSRYLGQILISQASALADLGEYEKARLCLEEAAAISKKVGFKLSSDYAEARLKLTFDLRKPDEAAAVIENFYGALPDRALLSLDLLRNAAARAQLALVRNDPANALGLATRLYDEVTQSPNRKYLRIWEQRAALAEGNAYLLQHRASQALPVLRHAMQLDAEMYDPSSAELIPARVACAAAYLQTGNRAESAKLLALAESVHKVHPHLGERFETPLRELKKNLRQKPGTRA